MTRTLIALFALSLTLSSSARATRPAAPQLLGVAADAMGAPGAIALGEKSAVLEGRSSAGGKLLRVEVVVTAAPAGSDGQQHLQWRAQVLSDERDPRYQPYDIKLRLQRKYPDRVLPNVFAKIPVKLGQVVHGVLPSPYPGDYELHVMYTRNVLAPTSRMQRALGWVFGEPGPSQGDVIATFHPPLIFYPPQAAR